ncbi:SRPBCC domain-containing protein [Chryseolinea sp. Jin1]|uniref:SRPBCC domain-containing protein n=2 Tax=Chryseolinea lacunae TaxID=2801331 RepID=A0ABS1KR62_9BACT|nr:SRPBCC domain-containing protein [Chryseolinea lacunae]
MTANATVRIDAPVSEVWKALVTPSIIKKYLFGTQTESDWTVGSAIIFKGEWEGKSYEDKGSILVYEPNRLLRYTYWSSMNGTPDLPENYHNVSYILTPDDAATLLTVTQDGVETEKQKKHSEQNWTKVLNTLKDLMEKKA